MIRAATLAAAALAVGCQMPGAEFVGSYEPHYVLPDGASSPVSGTTLRLLADGRFQQEGFPVIEGKWRFDKGEVVLQPERKAGMSPAQAGLSNPRFAEVRMKASNGQLEEAADGSGSRTVWKRR